MSMRTRKKKWNALFGWREEVVLGVELGIGGKRLLAGLDTGNEVVLGGLCRRRDVCLCEDGLEIDDLESSEFSVHVSL